jgi:prepilin-type N-terminal cleavage/methylation domain-containing protein/prepilin-type processing-associated H-X9-DG protein
MRKAFTLIELLVVIAVIAVLAALLFPVFVKARERAKSAHCMSNLRQIGAAVGAYLSDWDEVYPWAYTGDSVVKHKEDRPSFYQVMSAYVTDKLVWQCPSDVGEIFLNDPLGWNYQTPPYYSDNWAMSSYDYLGVGWSDYLGRIGGYPATRVKRPSQAVLSPENRPWHDRDRAGQDLYNSPGLANVLYCDGHVAKRTRRDWGLDARWGLIN